MDRGGLFFLFTGIMRVYNAAASKINLGAYWSSFQKTKCVNTYAPVLKVSRTAALTAAQVYINAFVPIRYCFYSNGSFTGTCTAGRWFINGLKNVRLRKESPVSALCEGQR